MSYQKLSKALNDSVRMYTPDVLYPRECLIVNVNENDTLKIKVNIGENIYLDEVRYIGIPKIYTTGLFIPLNNNYDEGYCICYNETTESLTENVIINNYSDSVTEEVNEVKESEEETSDEISNETSEKEQTNINYDRRYAKINHTHTENVGTIEDLKTLIKNTKEGNILSLDKNFKNERYGNIIINKKITIDGNGHSIENISFTCDTDEIELNNIVFFNVTTNRVNGGALQLNGQRISINNCIFYNNIINGTSVYEGGAISVNSSSVETKIVDCYFIDNFCSNNGGAIRWIANNGVLIGCKFIGNVATNSGGAIKWLGINGLIRDCLFENNKSNNAKDILTTDENLMGIGNKFLTESDIVGSEKFYDYVTEFDKKEIEDEIHSSFGRNILYDTQEMIVSTPPNNISYTEEFRKNKVVYFDNESSNPNGYRDWYYDIAIDEFNYNDEFTFSFWVKSDKKNIGKIKTYFTGGTDYIKTKVINSNGYDSLDIFSDGHITFDVNDEWKKCFVTWKLNSTGAKIYKRAIIRIYDGAKIYLSSPKLERGKVSTDWTPNPNDKINNYQIIGKEYIDLNRIWKTGIYRCLTVNEAKSNIDNLPLDFQMNNAIPFVLEVIQIGDNSCKQRITFYNNVKTFEYVRIMQNFNWSQWQIVENQVNCICYTSNVTGSNGFGKILKIKNILPTTNYNTTIGFDVYQKNKKFPIRCYLKFKNENIENFNIGSFYYYGENSDIYIINSKDKEWDLYVKKSDEEDVIEIKNLTINDTYTTKENKLEFYPLGQEINNDDFISIYDETDTHSAKAVKSDYCLDKEQTDSYYLSLNGGNLNGDLNVNGNIIGSNNLTINNNVISNDLTVNRNATIYNDLTVNRNATIYNNLTIRKNTNVNNNLTVNGILSIVHPYDKTNYYNGTDMHSGFPLSTNPPMPITFDHWLIFGTSDDDIPYDWKGYFSLTVYCEMSITIAQNVNLYFETVYVNNNWRMVYQGSYSDIPQYIESVNGIFMFNISKTNGKYKISINGQLIGNNINTLQTEIEFMSNSNGFVEGNGTVNYTTTDAVNIIDIIYPIGSIYMSVNDVSPNMLFGGQWEKLKNRFLIGSGDVYTNGATGGETTHTLTVNEMPSHRHTANADGTQSFMTAPTGSGWNEDSASALSGSGNYYPYSTSTNHNVWVSQSAYTGGSGSHNNMPPYLAVNIWKRIG